MVITAAARERKAEPCRVDLENHARIIAEIADEAEVEPHEPLHTIRREQAVDGAEIVKRAAALFAERETVCLRQDFLAARKHRQLAQVLLCGRRKRQLVDGRVIRHEVMLLKCVLERLLVVLGNPVLLHDARRKFDLAEADLELLEPRPQQALDGEREHLRVRRCRRGANELDACLIELALPSHLALFRAEDAADVRELQRQRRILEAAADDARNRRRHLMTQRQRPPALVKELEELR